MNIVEIITNIAYLVASVLFIYGIKYLGSPRTARTGNFISATGMFIAVVVTLLSKSIISYELIVNGIVIGSLIGTIMSVKVKMTSMPQMVGALNGFGGGASVLVAFSEYYRYIFDEKHQSLPVDINIAIGLSIIVGAVTFSGSFIAFGKLQELISGKVIKFPLQNAVNLILIVGVVALTVYTLFDVQNVWLYVVMIAVGLVLGVLVVLPIGGADMPVVISLLNSYSGIAAAMTGFVLQNVMLIIAGALVGASGIILTNIMCKGMNRSLMNVLLGGWDNTGGSDETGTSKRMDVKSVEFEEAAMIFDSASSVIIVPGYGMAVAQAQHAVRDLANILEKKGIQVRFAIHPVAGRMPGHMNVLLAEANVPYDKLFALEEINDDFSNTDVVLVIGANDVVNPAAKTNPQSPIFGMPVLNVEQAKTVIINKRSMATGYAGIENELFGYPNALMYFGDAKDALTKLTNELKNY